MANYGARKFSQKSYNENDKWAKELFIPYLIKKGYTIENAAETFEHDILAVSPEGEPKLFELEVKIGYPFKNKKTYSFPTVSFTGRKQRLHKIYPFIYVIICKETKWALCAESKDIYSDIYTEELFINKNSRVGNDKFFRVPIQKCTFFNLES